MRRRLLVGLLSATAALALVVALATRGLHAPSTGIPGGSRSPIANLPATALPTGSPSATASAKPSSAGGTSPKLAARPTVGPSRTLPPGRSVGPATALHYAANGNWSGGTYVPGSAGFNLADIGGADATSGLPAGVKGLIYVGSCGGADSAFTATVNAAAGNPRVYGFYLVDEPDPASCPASNLQAEADYVHAHAPGAKTFIVLMNMSSDDSPTFTYNPANTHVDLYGLDPYPCRNGKGCNDSWIQLAVHAAENAGVPLADIVPVYQAFGGGTWPGGGDWALPTAQQETTLLADWARVVPSPAFDYAYSWGSQNGDTALGQSSDLQAVFRAHNGR